LALLALLIAGVLLRALARPLLQRLEAARQALRAIERLLLLVAGVLPLLALTERGRRFIEPLLQLIDAARDVVLGRAQRLLAVAAIDERFRVANLVAQAVVANRARRLGQLARGRALLLRRVARRRVEIAFELAELALEIVLLLVDALRLVAPLLAVGGEAVDAVGDLLLLARALLGALLRVLDIAVR